MKNEPGGGDDRILCIVYWGGELVVEYDRCVEYASGLRQVWVWRVE